jgi:hypothetical protein
MATVSCPHRYVYRGKCLNCQIQVHPDPGKSDYQYDENKVDDADRAFTREFREAFKRL